MKFSRRLGLVAGFLLQLLPALADDVITNLMSSVVSYHYPDDFSSEVVTKGGVQSPFVSFQYLENLDSAALTNGGILSSIISYQYFEWPGDDILRLQRSPTVSYYYPFLDTPPLRIISTSRTPTKDEITSPLGELPTTSKLLVYDGGVFADDTSSIEANRPTIVLTHGWIPTRKGIPMFPDNGVNSWPKSMAARLRANGVFTGNILAWDWSQMSRSDMKYPGIAEQQTGEQGQILGQKLRIELGGNYSKRIHFIGHSLGTLVNGWAANYLHGDRWAQENVSPEPWWPAENTLMTLFDEAEVAREVTTIWADIDIIFARNGNPLTPSKPFDHPLPKQFAWAENYVAAVGLLQTNAANVILTNKFPANAPSVSAWLDQFSTFHGYPMTWYDETIQTDNSAMGYVWPFLWSLGDDATFANAPSSAGSVYVQAGSEWSLTAKSWNYGTNLLAERYQKYRNALAQAITHETPESIAVNGKGSGQYIVGALPAFNSFIISLLTTPPRPAPAPQSKVHPVGLSPHDAGSDTNIPAYAWMPLVVPTNAVSLSFSYMIQGDWQSDSFVAAFNGTNMLSLLGKNIETNILFGSGSIDVSDFGGQTNEFFIGIVGGTSTNAQLTVENLAFSISSAPSLQAQLFGSRFVVTWPLLIGSEYVLEATDNLAATNSWAVITDIPAVVNFQNVVTNEISGTAHFYRLMSNEAIKQGR